MQFCMLIEPQLRPVPSNLTVREYGSETIVVNNKVVAAGVSALITGDEAAIRSWLGSVDGVWLSNNPGIGEWYIAHIAPGPC